MAIYNPGSSGTPMPSYSAPPRASSSSALGGVASGAISGAMAGGPWGAAIGAGSALASAALGNKGSNRAAKAQQQSADKAMAYQREVDAKEEARYKEQEAKLEAQWNAEQARIAEVEARRAPYRQAAEALLGQNANRLGIAFSPSSRQVAPTAMPPGWTPGSVQAAPKTLASLAGTGYVPPDVQSAGVEAPKLTLSDILNSRWGADRRVS